MTLNYTDQDTYDNTMLPYKFCGLKDVSFLVNSPQIKSSLIWTKENFTLTFAPTTIQPQEAYGTLNVTLILYPDVYYE